MSRSETAVTAAGAPANRIDVDYCRISYDKTGAEEGVGSQHLENVEFADEGGRELSESYVDNDVSAYSGVERPEYERLCRDMAAGRIASVTFWHAKRLHRDIEQASRFLRVAREQGVRLFSFSKGGEYNLKRSAGRQEFLKDTLDGQGESDERGDRVALARKRQARNGDWGGGVRAYGWGVDTKRVRSVCVNPKAPAGERRYEDRPVLDMSKHREAEAAEIKSWASDLLGGVPMRHVLRSLAEREVPTIAETDGRDLKRNGKAVKHEGWNSRTVVQILTHPRTAGHSEYKGEILKRNAYPAIIAEDQRQALITLFADPTRKTSPGNTPKWLGSLIYLCGVCNDAATMSVRNNSAGQPIYRCRVKGHCARPALLVDALVEQVIIGRLSRPDVVDLIPNETAVDVTALRDELRNLDAQETDLGLSIARRAISLAVAEVAQAEIDRQRSEIRADLAAASAESPLTDFAATDAAEPVWRSLSLGRRREILRLLGPVTLMPGGRGRAFDPETVVFPTTKRPAA